MKNAVDQHKNPIMDQEANLELHNLHLRRRQVGCYLCTLISKALVPIQTLSGLKIQVLNSLFQFANLLLVVGDKLHSI